MNNAGGENSPPSASPVPLIHGCKTIISCIKQEKIKPLINNCYFIEH